MTDTTPVTVAVCLACGKTLKPEFGDVSTNYQFDNALWLGFHGGYGMFLDNCEATLPTNTEDRWLRGEDDEYIIKDGGVVLDPAWQPTYDEPRLLPGSPDHEAVICHECAHELCEAAPWIKKLLDPDNSHACTF